MRILVDARGEKRSEGLRLLLRRMKSRAISQAELARRVRRDAGVVSRWIRAERKPDADSRTLLAHALDIPEALWDRAPRSSFRIAA